MSDHLNQELGRMRAMVAELAGLNDIIAAVSGTLSVREITEVIIDKTLRQVNAGQGAVFLLSNRENVGGTQTSFARLGSNNADTSAPHLTTFVRRRSAADQELPLHLNENLAAWVMKNKRLLVINSPQEAQLLDELDLDSLGITSLLAAPLRTASGIIGILAVFNKVDPGGFLEQDTRFLGILGTQCAQTIETARLYEEEKNLVRYRLELDTARQIQQKFLPQPGEHIDHALVCGFNEPAREVGGDFFDVKPLPDGRLFVSIGDVSGKGVPAALLMACAVAIQRSHLSDPAGFSLEHLARSINEVLCQYQQSGQFICGIFAIYDPPNRTLDYINAGHPAPIIVHRCDPIDTAGESGLVLGVLPDTPYHVNKLQLPDDSLVCLYTDGITEACDPTDAFYGEQRLIDHLISQSSLTAHEVCTGIRITLAEFRGEAVQSDDITAVILRVPGA